MSPTEVSNEVRFGYDHVHVPSEEGRARLLTRGEFEKLPLRQRVDLIIKGQLKFYLNGEPIPASRALKGGY